MNLIITISLIVFAVLIFFWVIWSVLTRLYVKASADRAFVLTGGTKPRVVVNGGAVVIRAFREITWVDLRTMDIDIERTEDNALLTIDPQYADIRAIFYIKVNPTIEDIERAARTIGGGDVNTANVKRLVESKLEGALRDVAATFTLMSLHQEREKFVERVQNLVRADLAENGLVLESVSITALKSARQGSFGTDDVFGAQVARANAAVIQTAIKERNEIDQTTQTEIAQRDATAEQERNDIEQRKRLEIARRNSAAEQERNDIERNTELEIARRNALVQQEKLALERNIEQSRATQQREILIRQSEEKSAADRVSYEQQQAAELARVIKERAVAEAEQEKEQAVRLAEQRKQQAIELADQERQREVERSRVLREQSVQVADQERQVALSRQQALREQAEKDRLAILAEREAAEQQVYMVQETAAAERESRIQIINAERDAKREMINRKNEVELTSYRQIKEAEAQANALNQKASAEATAAIQMAEARRTEAQATADAERIRAEAARVTAAAAGLAEADVIRARAEAASLEAEAIKARGLAEAEAIKARGLAEAEGQRAMADALAANDGVSQRLELERLRLATAQEIGISQAQAMGEAMAAMDFKLYGSPDTAQQILRMVSMADGVGGVLQAMPAPLKDLGNRLAERILPGNGSSHTPEAATTDNGAEQATNEIDLERIQQLLLQGGAILIGHLSADERRKLTLRAALEQVLSTAAEDSTERQTLSQLQKLINLLPMLANQKVERVLTTSPRAESEEAPA